MCTSIQTPLASRRICAPNEELSPSINLPVTGSAPASTRTTSKSLFVDVLETVSGVMYLQTCVCAVHTSANMQSAGCYRAGGPKAHVSDRARSGARTGLGAGLGPG